jgi:hypothetical protein
LGPARNVGVLKIAHPKAKPGSHGTSEIQLALVKPVGVSKKFHILDAPGLSHRPPTPGVTTTRAAQVPAFNNIDDDSSSDVRRMPSPVRTIERRVSLPPSVFGEFLCFSLAFVTVGADSCFTGFAVGGFGRKPGKLLASCKFCFAFVFSCFCTRSDQLFDFVGSCMAGKQRVERAIELVQIAKNAELEVLVRSQVEKITELEMTYDDLKHGKENVTAGYHRLVAKQDAFVGKVEQEKVKLAEAHAMKVAKLCVDLDLETRSYMEYHQTVRRQLCELHETVASSFDEVQE